MAGWLRSQAGGRRRTVWLLALAAVAAAAGGVAAHAIQPHSAGQPPAMAAQAYPPSDIPDAFSFPTAGHDYVKREVMVPMRDGVRLYTVILIPRGAANAPILLTRTPYNASRRVARNNSPRMIASLPQGDEVFVEAGYIRVFQDVRGKYKSEGDYVVTRPVRGPLNPTGTDHVTDAYDTIEWLVKNVP